MCIIIMFVNVKHNFHIASGRMLNILLISTYLRYYCEKIAQIHFLFFLCKISIVFNKFIFEAIAFIFSMLIIGYLVS